MKTKCKKTWHIELTDGTIVDFKTKKAAQRAAREIKGNENLIWCSKMEWTE